LISLGTKIARRSRFEINQGLKYRFCSALRFSERGSEVPNAKDDRRETPRRQSFVRLTYLSIDQAVDDKDKSRGAHGSAAEKGK
jgi:hypothetical protein